MLHASSPQPRHPIVSPNSVSGNTPATSASAFQSPDSHNKLLFNHANHQQYVYPLSAPHHHYSAASSVVSPTRMSKHKDSMWSTTWLQLLVTMTVVLLFVLALSSFSTVEEMEDPLNGDYSATAFIDGAEGNVERAQIRDRNNNADITRTLVQPHKKKVKRSKFHTLTASVVAGASLISPLRSARAALNFATKSEREEQQQQQQPTTTPSLSPAAAAAVTHTSITHPHSQPQASPRVLLRILASGSHYHAEFDRLLHSLLEAQYELGVDMIDIEILVDLPRNLTSPIEQKFKGTLTSNDVAYIDGNTSPTGENPDAIAGDINADEDGGQGPIGSPSSSELKQLLQGLLKNDPAYQALKSEHELHEILARNFQWIHGSVSVRTVHFSTKQLAGFFNQFLSWNPLPFASASVAASSNTVPTTSSSSPEYAFMVKETHVLSKQWFQVIKRLIKQYEAQQAKSGSSQSAGGNMFGIQLEPAEIFLGIDASTPTGEYQEKKFFQDPLVKASAAATASTGKNEGPSMLYGQMSSSVGLGIGGGLLLPTHRYAEFRAWVVHLGLLARDAQDTPVSDDYGAPIAWVYNEQTAFPFNNVEESTTPASASTASLNVFNPCVPGLISNHWFDTQVAVKNGKEQWRAFHDRRKHEPWFLFSLLNRFMYERGYFNMIPFWMSPDPSSSSLSPKVQTLITSPKFLFEHNHQQSNDPALLQQQQMSGTHMHDSSQSMVEADPASWTNLIPMRFELISHIDFDKWDAQIEKDSSSSASSQPISVFDFAGKLFDPKTFKPAASIDCNLWLRNVPTSPPSTRPSKEEREHIEQVLAAKARLKASQAAASSTGAAVDPEAVALELQNHLNEYKGLSQKELLQMALRTAEQHKAVVPLSPLESVEKAAAAQQQPSRPPPTFDADSEEDSDLPSSSVSSNSTDIPVLPANSSSNGNHSLIDLESFHDNVTALEQARWESYEADFQFELSKASMAEKERLLKEHEKLRQAHEAHLRVLQEELEKKNLILSLKNQLETIQNRELEDKENVLLKKYKEKKKKLKKELAKQKKLQAEQEEKAKALKEQQKKEKEEAAASAKSKSQPKKDDSKKKPSEKEKEKEKGKKDKAVDEKAKKDKSSSTDKADSKKDKDKKKPAADKEEKKKEKDTSDAKAKSGKDKSKDKEKDKKSKGDKSETKDKDKKKSDKSDTADNADKADEQTESKKDKKSQKPTEEAPTDSESEETAGKKKKKSRPPPPSEEHKKNDKSKAKEKEKETSSDESESSSDESAAESKSSTEEKPSKKKDGDKSNNKSKDKPKESDKNKNKEKEKDNKGKDKEKPKEKDTKSKGKDKDKSKDSDKEKSNSSDKSKTKKDESKKKKESSSSDKDKGSSSEVSSSSDSTSSTPDAGDAKKEDAVDGEGVINDAEYERIMAARRERKKNKQHKPLYLG